MLKKTFLAVQLPVCRDLSISHQPGTHRLEVYNLLYEFLLRHNTNRSLDGLSKYLYTWFKHILALGGHTKRFWMHVSYALEQRQFRAHHGSPFIRYRKYFPVKYTFHAHLLEALYIAMSYKNLSHLVTYLRQMFTAVNFFKHKFLLYFFRAVFSELNRCKELPVRGLFIKFRGKLAQAGNSRRKRFLVGCGQVSTSYGSLYRVEKFQIKTFTGAIGCTIILSFM